MKIITKEKVSESYTDPARMFDYIDFPTDYLEFINEYGEGIVGEYIKIYPKYRSVELEVIWERLDPRWKLSKFYIATKYSGDSAHFFENAILIGETLFDDDQIIYWKGNYYIYRSVCYEKLINVGSKLDDVFDFYISENYLSQDDAMKFIPFYSEFAESGIKELMHRKYE